MSKAGDKKKLSESAAYPRPFGMALAGLFKKGSADHGFSQLVVDYPAVGDDLGALEDFLKGRTRAWWRRL